MGNLPEISKIDQLLHDLDRLVSNIYAGNMAEAQAKLNISLQAVSVYYTYLISNAPRYGALGVEVPVDVLSQHIINMNDAIDNGDLVMLTDTLRYEIKEGLVFLKELVKQEISEQSAR